MTKHEKIMELGIQHCLAQIGGRAEFQGDKLVLWGACTACPLQALNVTADIRELTEIEIDADFCPVSGCGCPLFHFFTTQAKFLWRERKGEKRGICGMLAKPRATRRIRWPFTQYPIFKNNGGAFSILLWENGTTEIDVYEVGQRVFPFEIKTMK
jgi:hypothetical protein